MVMVHKLDSDTSELIYVLENCMYDRNEGEVELGFPKEYHLADFSRLKDIQKDNTYNDKDQEWLNSLRSRFMNEIKKKYKENKQKVKKMKKWIQQDSIILSD
jgi:hypothetical protein